MTERRGLFDRKTRIINEARKTFPLVEASFLGEKIPFVYAGWGKHLKTPEMLTQWSNQISNVDRDVITNYGFSGGWFWEEDYVLASERARELNIRHATALTETLMRLRGWDEATLFFTSVSSPPDILPEVKARLLKKGLKIKGDPIYYGLACDGGGGEMLDALGRPELAGEKTVFIATETLSGDSTPRKNIRMSTLFGNGGGGTAFVVGEEVKLVDPSLLIAMVKKDEDGLIKLPRAYEVANFKKERTNPPPWYEVDENAKDTFLFGKNLVLNAMPTQEGELARYSSLDERRTGVVFRKLAVEVAKKILTKFYELFPDKKLNLGIFHQPNHTIALNAVGKLEETFGDRCPSIPWLMEETGFNNISSATIFIALTQAVKKGLIKNGESVLLETYGEGLSGHAGVVKFEF